MEVFLLLLDELDDAAGVLRHLWSRLIGLLLAAVLFAATGWFVLHQPRLSAALIAALLSFALLDRARRRAQSRADALVETRR